MVAPPYQPSRRIAVKILSSTLHLVARHHKVWVNTLHIIGVNQANLACVKSPPGDNTLGRAVDRRYPGYTPYMGDPGAWLVFDCTRASLAICLPPSDAPHNLLASLTWNPYICPNWIHTQPMEADWRSLTTKIGISRGKRHGRCHGNVDGTYLMTIDLTGRKKGGGGGVWSREMSRLERKTHGGRLLGY